MGVSLRVVLDQAVHVVDRDQADAARSLMRGLGLTAPTGCTVEALVPAGAETTVAGADTVQVLPLGRRELVASWQIGIVPGVGGGLIHAPSLLAPLVRHDRANDGDQISVTVWDLSPWEAPETLPKTTVVWKRAMLRRAVKHADAVIVPSHDLADRLSRHARLGDRIRVIEGAVPESFSVPIDAAHRRKRLAAPGRYLVLHGTDKDASPGFRAAVAADIDVVVIDVPEGAEARVVDAASAAGLPSSGVRVLGAVASEDRAALLAEAAAFVSTSALPSWPWRAMEAMALGVPLVAVGSGVHRDIVAEGGVLVDADGFSEAVVDAVGAGGARLRILAGDRARAFSWASAAERVWALHADL